MSQSNSSNAQNWDEHIFSQSTNNLLSQIQQHTEGVDLLQVMEKLHRIHSEYGTFSQPPKNPFHNLIQFLNLSRNGIKLNKYPSEEWVAKVLAITTTPKNFPDINGRMFLIAALLSEYNNIDSILKGNSEWQNKCWALIVQLENELLSQKHIDLPALLTEHGHESRNLVAAPPTDAKKEDHDTLIKTHNTSDAPTKEDKLSRKPLAEYIAKRLRFVYDEAVPLGAFFMHIDGAWGSGKSTLLGFLEKELEKNTSTVRTRKSKQGWYIVKFNAWENQRLDPPWWFLMQTVYQSISHKVWLKNPLEGLVLSAKELWWQWRISTGYTIAAILALIIFVVAIVYKVPGKEGFDALLVTQIVSFLGLIWSLAKSVSSNLPLSLGSSKAAQSFIETNGADPMQKLSKHFKDLIEGLDKPVAIFIDDLDRCNSAYGVKLIEGLQTIFNKAPVVYIIAADRRWLKTMYEEQYKPFASTIATATKPFGLFFLDKIFNFIVELPDISAVQKKIYWESLLQTSKNKTKKNLVTIQEDVKYAKTFSDKLELVNQTENTFDKQQYREEIVRSISIEKEEKDIEHKLMAFVDLIEPNPRAMKRLINDIGTAKMLSILYDQHVEQEQLILWTILKQQHPALAAFLWEEPERMDTILSATTNIKEYDDLLKKEDVKRLFEYPLKDPTVKLDTAFLEKMRFQSVKDSV
jgi:hypothetical protein